MKNRGRVIWNKRRQEALDYLRVELFQFNNPEDSYGMPPNWEEKDITVYGWENIPYDPHKETQTRRIYVLEPEDLGGYKFDFADCETEYPNRVYDAHTIRADSQDEELVEPTPEFNLSSPYQLSNIPDRVHPHEDTIRFRDAQCYPACIELYDRHGKLKDRLTLDRSFSTYTLIDMYREIDDFGIPTTLSKPVVSSEI